MTLSLFSVHAVADFPVNCDEFGHVGQCVSGRPVSSFSKVYATSFLWIE